MNRHPQRRLDVKVWCSALLFALLAACGGEATGELGGEGPALEVESGLTSSVAAEADTWTRSASVTANKGADVTLQVDASDSSGGERRSYLRFSVQGTRGQRVVAAKLRLRCLAGSVQGGELFAVSNVSWGERTLTWSNQPVLGASLVRMGKVVAGSDVDFDVSTVVRGDGVYSFALTTSSTDNAQYASREARTGQPRLVLTFAEDGDTAAPQPPPPADAGTSAPIPTPPPVTAVVGIWTSPQELATKPTSGPAFSTLKSYADSDTSAPDISNQDDPTNVRVLAAAIVYARTGEAAYRNKVITALQNVVGTEAGGRSLAWGREVGAYVIAADLVGYRTKDFEAWVRHVADGAKCSQLGITLREMFKQRPNNWGSMAFGSLAAIDRYVGDTQKLSELRGHWVRMVEGPNPGAKYGELSWHVDPANPRLINPKGAVKDGVRVDGIIPDDMRRGGPFTTGSPAATGYPWEHLQGTLMGAQILARAGMPIWDVGDHAIFRAAYALQVRLGGTWVAQGDDLWQLAFLDAAYGTRWSVNKAVYGAGKNAGFAYVLP